MSNEETTVGCRICDTPTTMINGGLCNRCLDAREIGYLTPSQALKLLREFRPGERWECWKPVGD